MANTGFIIHPSVIQVFTSGPNSGSIVSASFNETFNSGSGFTSASLCDNEYVYREQDLENCPVVDECPIPTFVSLSANNCTNPVPDRTYTLFVNLSTEATTLFVEYSTSATFSTNVGTFSKSATSNAIFSVNISDLSSLPISKTTPIYFRCYFDCGGENISDYSPTKSTSCPPQELPASLIAGFPSTTSCYTCVGITVQLPRGTSTSRTVRITKTGTAVYAPGFCTGVNQVASNINEVITSKKTYNLGLDAAQTQNNNLISRITIQVLKGNVVEDTYILTRQHINNFC